MSIEIRVKLLRDAAIVYGEGDPEQALAGLTPATSHSVGIDLRACLEGADEIVIEPGGRFPVGSGLSIEPVMAEGAPGVTPAVAGFVYSRSGLGAKHGLVVAQGVGVIDPDYRGEIIVWLLNTSKTAIKVHQGDRMAQLVFLNYHQPAFQIVHELGETQRGAGGFGHTGK